MHKKRALVVGIVIACMLLAAGIVYASPWGSYLGYPIVRITIDGNATNPSAPAILIKGSTYVPLRFVSESLGQQVVWNGASTTVDIITETSSGTSQMTSPTASTSLPKSVTNKGVTITLSSVQATSSSTTLHMIITNNSDSDVDFPASLTQIVAGSTQFDAPTEYDYVFLDDLRPGVIKEGDIKFPALPAGTQQIRIYSKVWIGPSLDTVEGNFTVSIK